MTDISWIVDVLDAIEMSHYLIFLMVSMTTFIVIKTIQRHNNGTGDRLWIGTGWLGQIFSSKLTCDSLRSEFRRIQLQPLIETSNHSHPWCASDRSGANTAIDRFIRSQGYIPYSISMSDRDIFQANDGTREFHVAKDFGMDYRFDSVQNHHILKYIDTDYYVDIKHQAESFRPMIMYTFVPRRVAGSLLDAVFRMEGDEVETIVNGGARYRHKLWNYDTDCIAFDFWWGTSIFKVEQIRTNDENRRIIGLFPVRKVFGPMGWTMPGFRLERRNNICCCVAPIMEDNPSIIKVCRELNISKYLTWGKTPQVMYSIAKIGVFFDINITEAILHSILVRCGSKKMPHIADIERILRESKIEDAPTMATSIYEIYPNLLGMLHKVHIGLQTSASEVQKMPDYQTLYPLVMEDGQPMIRAVCPPLCQGNVAPVRSYNNDTACVQGRIEGPRNTIPRWPGIYNKYAQDFLDNLIPSSDVHIGVPYSTEQVEELQSRPTQRASWLRDSVTSFMHRFKVGSFQKAESYSGLKYPRNISTTNADHRTRYGSFMYAFTERVLKRQKWYAFGKTPCEIAAAVHDLVRPAQTVIPTDFTHWDGTHSEMLAEFEKLAGMRFFNPIHHSEWKTLQGQQYNSQGYTKFGVKYNTGWGRLSGSGDTSPFNTLCNALIAYFTLRECGQDNRLAWANLGLYGGDDGLTTNVPVATYTRIAKRMGHTLKCSVLYPGSEVPFLGRYYLDPWQSARSVSDIQRQVRKLHLTTASKDVPVAVALRRKADGILTTDPNTPIISNWARLVQRVHPAVPLTINPELMRDQQSWWAQYVNDGEKFPTYEPNDDLSITFAAKQMTTDVSLVQTICHVLDEALTLEDIPINAFETPLEVAIDAVFQGEIRAGPPYLAPQNNVPKTQPGPNSAMDRCGEQPIRRRSDSAGRPSDQSQELHGNVEPTRPSDTVAPKRAASVSGQCNCGGNTLETVPQPPPVKSTSPGPAKVRKVNKPPHTHMRNMSNARANLQRGPWRGARKE